MAISSLRIEIASSAFGGLAMTGLYHFILLEPLSIITNFPVLKAVFQFR
jgi:hypothetical protein